MFALLMDRSVLSCKKRAHEYTYSPFEKSFNQFNKYLNIAAYFIDRLRHQIIFIVLHDWGNLLQYMRAQNK